MKPKIEELANKSKFFANDERRYLERVHNREYSQDEWQDICFEKFAELIKQAIYDDVKEELIDDAIINEEPDPLAREYLKGCNGGTVDALCHIKNFGVEIKL